MTMTMTAATLLVALPRSVAPRTLSLLALVLVASSATVAAHAATDSVSDANERGNYRDPFDDTAVDDGTTHITPIKTPASLLDFVEHLAPVLKYYVVLLGLFAVARYFNRAVEAEGALQDKERTRPNLRHELMEDSDDDESDGGTSDCEEINAVATSTAAANALNALSDLDEIDEELVTDGSKLVAVTTNKQKNKTNKQKNHPLFAGLQKIEQELAQKQTDGATDADVSWNELHANMLKRYQQKYPAHGLRVQTNDDYDDEFKELMKKHNIDPDALKREVAQQKDT